MVIVFDTSPLLADRTLSKPPMQGILGECADGRLRVVVPRVVIEEVVHAADGYIRSAQRNLNKAFEALEKHFLTPPSVPSLDRQAETTRFRKNLIDELTSHEVEIAEWIGVTHDEVVARDLARRPPFDDSGRGYRDALTWHALKDLVNKEGEPSVILVTRDRDFSRPGAPTVLHPALAEELDDPAQVIILETLDAVLRHVGDAREDLADEIAVAVAREGDRLGEMTLFALGGAEIIPYGLDSSLLTARLIDPYVESVAEAWGVVSAVVFGALDYTFVGTLNEMEFEIFRRSPRASYDDYESEWDDENR